MIDDITLDSVSLDCPDPARLAAFYHDITGWPITDADDDCHEIDGGATKIGFQLAPDYTPPIWPDPRSSMQIHLDFNVVDIEAAEACVLEAGATKFDHQPGGHFHVYADPVGHPFCLCFAPRPQTQSS